MKFFVFTLWLLLPLTLSGALVFNTDFEYSSPVSNGNDITAFNNATGQVGNFSSSYNTGSDSTNIFGGATYGIITDGVGTNLTPATTPNSFLVVDRPVSATNTPLTYTAQLSSAVAIDNTLSIDLGVRALRSGGNEAKNIQIVGRSSTGTEVFSMWARANSSAGSYDDGTISNVTGNAYQIGFDETGNPSTTWLDYPNNSIVTTTYNVNNGSRDFPEDYMNVGNFINTPPTWADHYARLSLDFSAVGLDFTFDRDANRDFTRNGLGFASASPSNLASIDFIIPASNSTGSSGGLALESLVVNGTIVPEPTTSALVLIAGFALTQRRKRS